MFALTLASVHISHITSLWICKRSELINGQAEWVWCLQQTIKSSLGSEHKNMEAHCIGPPVERHATYTFQKSGWLKDATYVGQWRNALMHGKSVILIPVCSSICMILFYYDL